MVSMPFALIPNYVCFGDPIKLHKNPQRVMRKENIKYVNTVSTEFRHRQL